MDFVRSCFNGKWRLFDGRPDLLTGGFHYFSPKNTPTITVPHPFGSGVWTKDYFHYPDLPFGQHMASGQDWRNGSPPTELPPDNQVGTDAQIQSAYTYPVSPPVELRNGFDKRCFVLKPSGVEFDIEFFLRPDPTSPCWWRVCAGLIFALTENDTGPTSRFQRACRALWGDDVSLVIRDDGFGSNRWAWIEFPDWQVVLRIGTQGWFELFQQIWHGFGPPRNYGSWATERVWHDESVTMLSNLNFAGFNPEKPVTFVGHSKGAAVCWIAARRMSDSFAHRDVEVIGFGSPKVGDARMVAQANINRAVHITHEQDIVPLIPPPLPIMPQLRFLLSLSERTALVDWEPFSTYTIIGGPILRNGSPRTLAWQTYAAWIEELRNQRVPEPVNQHFIDAYVTALNVFCCEPQFPFSNRLFDILFGGHECEPAGVRVIGGMGQVNLNLGGGVKIGGAGHVTAAAGGGVKLDGSGLVKLADGGGVKLTGVGALELDQGGGVELGAGGLVELELGGGVKIGGAGSAVFSQNPTIYDTPGTYTFTPIVTGSHVIEGWGGGQGGAGSLPITHSAGSGGVSGLYAKKTTTLTAGVGITVIVGAGGAVALAGGTRHNGGDTSAAAGAMVAPGGGTSTTAVGDVTHASSNGGTGFPSMGATGGGGGGGGGPGPSASGTAGSNGASTAGGAGGPGATGGGAGGNGGATSANGNDGTQPGGGGGGSGGGGTQSGKGADGRVKISW